MNARHKKVSFVLKKTQDLIDRYLKELAHLEKSILHKTEQMHLLERYKLDYGQQRLNQGMQIPSIMKSTYDFIGMLQKTADNIREEIQIIQQDKQQLINQMQMLNVRKDTISQYLKKIIHEEATRLAKIEQKSLDEFSIHQFMKNINENHQDS